MRIITLGTSSGVPTKERSLPATAIVYEGEIFLFDEKYTPNRLDLRKRIGVVPEKHPTGMWTWMTGFEYLKMFADLFGLKDSKERIEYLLEQVDLLEVGNKKIAEFSRETLEILGINIDKRNRIKDIYRTTMGEIMPYPFSSKNIKKK